jgi:mannose-1-phosphate guanylyltransferase
VIVVSSDWEHLAQNQIRDFGAADVVIQPRNVGTGPGILLPLSRIVARDPGAIVAIVPSDHYVHDEESFIESVRRAEAVAREENAVVLVAAMPDGPETQYGWIVTEPGAGSASRISGFVEKPAAEIANELFVAGALWNTFIMVGPAHLLQELGRQHLPTQSALFAMYRSSLGTPSESEVLANLYESMSPADFSRDVLERARALRVVPLAPCGWSDWGTPERVLKTLRGTRDYDVLIERLEAARFGPDGRSVSPAVNQMRTPTASHVAVTASLAAGVVP